MFVTCVGNPRQRPCHPVCLDGSDRSSPFGSSLPLSLHTCDVERATDAAGRSDLCLDLNLWPCVRRRRHGALHIKNFLSGEKANQIQ